jgi:DNA-binding XRE family transcriptional regulator
LTQKELAEQCNINERTLQRIETGDVTPRTYTVNVIFNVFGTECEYNVIHQENGSSAKVHFNLFNLNPKRKAKIWIISAAVLLSALILTIIFATRTCPCCRMQTTPITSIDAIAIDVNPRVQVIKLAEHDNDAVFLEDIALTHSKLNFKLPPALPPNALYRILVKHPNITRSDPDARFAFAKIEGYDNAGNLIGVFKLHNTQKHIEGRLIFADRDVTVTGKDKSDDIWCLSLKQGWNIIFFVPAENGMYMNTTNPGGMKWYFQ